METWNATWCVCVRDVKIHRFASVHGINVQDASAPVERVHIGYSLGWTRDASVKKRFIHIISPHLVSTQQRRSLIFASHYGGRESQLLTHMEVEEKEKHSAPKNTYKSNVWQHFEFFKKDGQLEKSLANCKRCRAALKYTSSTRKLATHIEATWGLRLKRETWKLDIWVQSLSEVFSQWEWCLVYNSCDCQ